MEPLSNRAVNEIQDGKAMPSLNKISSEIIKSHCKGLLLRVMETDKLLTGITLGGKTPLQANTMEWHEYWRPVLELQSPGLMKSLINLHHIWLTYIDSRYDKQFQSEYCYRYFKLLEQLLDLFSDNPGSGAIRIALKAVLGFECFGITEGSGHEKALAAATSTARNPCYLLSKLKRPLALDDAQFLPLISIAQSAPESLFYHYRQHRLASNPSNSILLYLASKISARAESYRVINRIEHWLADGQDPRAAERAARVADNLIIPYLSDNFRALYGNDVARPELEICDLGSGSGLLVAQICRRISSCFRARNVNFRFRLWMMDLSPVSADRHLRKEIAARQVDLLACQCGDYKSWFDRPNLLPRSSVPRLGLCSRFFNSFSGYEIMRVELEPWLSAYKRMVPGGRECWPSRCLAPDALAMDRLLFSNSRIDLSEGRTFAQVSLSPYFQGLKIVQRGASCHTQSDAGRAPIYLPVRRFQGDCLRTRKGASVLKRLLESCSLVIIQDADLRPSDLAAHWQLLKPNRFRGIDLTKFLGLRGHYCYALLHFNDEGAKSWKGVKLF